MGVPGEHPASDALPDWKVLRVRVVRQNHGWLVRRDVLQGSVGINPSAWPSCCRGIRAWRLELATGPLAEPTELRAPQVTEPDELKPIRHHGLVTEYDRTGVRHNRRNLIGNAEVAPSKTVVVVTERGDRAEPPPRKMLQDASERAVLVRGAV